MSSKTHREKSPTYIAWIDVETSGISPEHDELLEVAAILSEMDGTVVGEPIQTLISVPNVSETISRADVEVQEMHDRSGLWGDLWRFPALNHHQADARFTEWFHELVPEGSCVYFGGNTIVLDRNFLSIHMPSFHGLISHRSVDVTSLSIAIQSNTAIPGFHKGKAHRALDDAKDSLQEYMHYLSWLKSMTEGLALPAVGNMYNGH